MSTNYIEVYHVNNELNAKIHKNGKVCTLTNPNNIKKLLDICHKHNKFFNGKRQLSGNVDGIIKEFDSYYIRTKTRDKRLKVIKENVNKLLGKTKLVKKSPVGKIVVTATLATTLGLTAFAINNSKKENVTTIPYETQPTIEEVTEYVDEEVITPSASIQVLDNDYVEEEPEVIEETPVEESNQELEQMLQVDEFYFSYTDQSDNQNIANAKRYEDIFIKYGNMYGVDPNLLMAQAAQENNGLHYEQLNGKYATGIMQIERDANLNSTVKAYNFETGQYDEIYITQDKLEDLDTNIQIGAMKAQNQFKLFNYNIPLALQAYNFGEGNMAKSLNMCSDLENIPVDELKNDMNNTAWMDYRAFLGVGDKNYVEHVFSYIESGTVITILDLDGNEIQLKIINENVDTKQYG